MRNSHFHSFLRRYAICRCYVVYSHLKSLIRFACPVLTSSLFSIHFLSRISEFNRPFNSTFWFYVIKIRQHSAYSIQRSFSWRHRNHMKGSVYSCGLLWQDSMYSIQKWKSPNSCSIVGWIFRESWDSFSTVVWIFIITDSPLCSICINRSPPPNSNFAISAADANANGHRQYLP